MNNEEPPVSRGGELKAAAQYLRASTSPAFDDPYLDLGPRLIPTAKTHTPWPVSSQMPTAYCLREHDGGEAHSDPPEGRALPLTEGCSEAIQVCGDCGVYWPCPEELQQRMDMDPVVREEVVNR